MGKQGWRAAQLHRGKRHAKEVTPEDAESRRGQIAIRARRRRKKKRGRPAKSVNFTHLRKVVKKGLSTRALKVERENRPSLNQGGEGDGAHTIKTERLLNHGGGEKG